MKDYAESERNQDERVEHTDNVLQKSHNQKDQKIVTEAALECLKRGWSVNRTGIGHLVREMRKNSLECF